MQELLKFALSHGNQAWIDGNEIVLCTEVVDCNTKQVEIIQERASNMQQLRDLLGY